MPDGSRSRDIPTTRVPLDIGQAVVLDSVELSNSRSRRWIFADDSVRSARLFGFTIEFDIPEVELEFARRAEGCKDYVSSSGRPYYAIGCPLIQRFQQDKVALTRIKLVKADSCPYSDTYHVGAEIRVI